MTTTESDELLGLFLSTMAGLDERPKRETKPTQRATPRPADQIGRSPGDAYNAAGEAGWLELLGEYGWTVEGRSAGEVRLTRPGKDRGTSATLGHCKTAGGLPRLKVFSTNAHPFEADEGITYDLFGAFAMLKHGGDLKAAARDLATKGYGEQATEVKWSGTKTAPGGAGAGGKRPAELPPWVPFPTGILPEPLAGYVRESAEANGFDEAHVAVPLLAVLAGIIGNRRRVAVRHGWSEPCCLWAVTVGESGTIKSAGWGAADRIADEIDRELEAASDHERDAYRQREQAGADPGPRPAGRKLIVQDITVERIGPILKDNPNGLLVSMDELSVWFDMFTRYRKGGGSDVPRWLGMWEGRRLKVDRQTNGSSVSVPSALVSVAGTIQPGILTKAIGDTERQSGFLARLVLAHPPERKKTWRDKDAPLASLNAVAQLGRQLHDLPPAELALDDEARTRFGAYYDAFGESEWLELDGDKRAALAKGPRLTLRLAMIHHCVTRCAAGDSPFAGADGAPVCERIGPDSIGFGYQLAAWMMNELTRVYLSMYESAESQDKQLVRKILKWARRANLHKFPASELKRRVRGFHDTDAVRQFLDAHLIPAGLGQWEASGRHDRAAFVLSEAAFGRPPDDG